MPSLLSVLVDYKVIHIAGTVLGMGLNEVLRLTLSWPDAHYHLYNTFYGLVVLVLLIGMKVLYAIICIKLHFYSNALVICKINSFS